jgi:hypothetical protein
MYPLPHRHDRFPDHRVRVDVTLAIGRHLLEDGDTIADLACGDGTIATRLFDPDGQGRLILGDLAPGWLIQGPIEQTIEQLEPGSVGLFVCCETLEHLDDPDAVLAAIRKRTGRLLLSTPDGEADTRNPEHLWGWDHTDVRQMLERAGFIPHTCTLLGLRLAGWQYDYQIWTAL